ncbi:hypothetical protein RWE15_08370 [Virgibacillus halophilus]|uniref:YkuD domain-containing protein n=1 Tax=Tigheibacillus halophilus TaxID=361280 RepID=A0ABU5C548_9BACI|nr:hypothetical protein [Virgibacillus halophilus]
MRNIILGRSAKKSNKADEHLIDYPTSYQYGIVINYNTAKPKKGAGSAFFLHVDNGKPTGGCVSIPKAKMKKLMVSLKNKSHIIQMSNQKQLKSY